MKKGESMKLKIMFILTALLVGCGEERTTVASVRASNGLNGSIGMDSNGTAKISVGFDF